MEYLYLLAGYLIGACQIMFWHTRRVTEIRERQQSADAFRVDQLANELHLIDQDARDDGFRRACGWALGRLHAMAKDIRSGVIPAHWIAE